MIDDITGLPLLSSDIYQIPLNTDAIPYNDLQAETRLPRQPMLPDDIIPTIALTTGLRSDGTGEVVHTDDNHAQKVYVVNQPVSSGGGSGGFVQPTKFSGTTDFFISGITNIGIANYGPILGEGLLVTVEMRAVLDNIVTGYSRDAGRILLSVYYEDDSFHDIPVGGILMYYDPTTPALSKMYDELFITYPAGFDGVAAGMMAGDQLYLKYRLIGSFPVRVTSTIGYT